MRTPRAPHTGGTQPPTGARAPGRRVRILLVDGDPGAAEAIRGILQAEAWDVAWVRTGNGALEKARVDGADAVLSELSLADMTGADLCRALHQRKETSTVPVIVLSASGDVADRVASLRAGAFDYLVKPPDPRELVARLKAALDLRQARAGAVVAVLGGKGGVGTSLVAANLAVALRQQARATVALLDCGWGGSLDLLLNLQTRPGVIDLLSRLGDLEADDLDNLLTAHITGVQALLLDSGASSVIRPEELRRALTSLRRSRDAVVADVAPFPPEVVEAVFELADRLLLVLTPEITALRGAKLLAQRAEALGMARERIGLVLNRFPMRGGLQRRDVEGAIGLPLRAELPDDTKLLTYSINRGVPVVMSHPRSGVARQIGALARWLTEEAAAH